MPGDQPILVNSAGCGAAMKDYGRLLGTEEAKAFSSRVYDIGEWLARAWSYCRSPRRSIFASRCKIRAICATCSEHTSRREWFWRLLCANSSNLTMKDCVVEREVPTPCWNPPRPT